MNTLSHFDTVANLREISQSRLRLIEADLHSIEYLPIGQVGTVLEVYDDEVLHYLVEFADLQGREYALVVLSSDEVLALHYELPTAS